MISSTNRIIEIPDRSDAAAELRFATAQLAIARAERLGVGILLWERRVRELADQAKYTEHEVEVLEMAL